MDSADVLFKPAVIAGVLVLLTILYSWIKNRNVLPGPTGLPYLGLLPFLTDENCILKFEEYKKKYGDMYSFTCSGKLYINLCSTKAMREVQMQKSDCFVDRNTDSGVIVEMVRNGIFSVNGEPWKILRKFFIQKFRDYGLNAVRDDLAGPLYDSLNSAIENLKKTNKKPIKIVEFLSQHCAITMRKVIFGEKGVTDQEISKMIAAFAEAFEGNGAVNLLLSGPLAKFLIYTKPSFRKNMKEAKTMRDVILKCVKRMESSMSDNEPECIVQEFYAERNNKRRKNDPSFKYYTDEALVDSLFQFVGDGIATVAGFIAGLLNTLLEYPEEQEKLYSELMEVVGPNRQPSAEDRPNLPYVNAFVNEYVRTSKFLIFLPSLECTKETTVRGYKIPAGSITLLNFWSANHDKETFEDPDSFNPSRYMPSSGEKRLACQFIPRFLKDFPDLAEAALDAQLDLAEDEDVSIRKLAVKHLPGFCKETKRFITKIADILSQMLQSEDSAELATVHASLMNVLKLDVKATLKGIFIQLSSSENELVRKRIIQFLCTKFKFLPPELATKDVEEYVLEGCKKVFHNLSGEDFLSLLPLLNNLKIAKTIPAQQTIVSIIVEQAEFDADFDVTADNIIGYLHCVRQALPYFSPFVSSSQFVIYICMHILPKLDDIAELEDGSMMSLEIIKLLAEMSPFINNCDQINDCTEAVYDILLKYIPLPPVIDSENGSKPEEPNVQFTYIECLLYTFIQMLKHNAEFLTSPDNSQRLKDLKSRLQFLARGVQNGIKTFRESLVSNKTKEVKAEETKLKAIALRTMNNINSLIKDLFRSPPSYKSAITLSWRPITASITKPTISTSVKRELDTPIFDDRKHMKRETKAGREIYAPPSGKYSTNVSFSRPRGNYYPRGRGRRFY